MSIHLAGLLILSAAQKQHTLCSGGTRCIFCTELETCQGIAGALSERFQCGRRLAFFCQNSPEYIEVVYACSWLGSHSGFRSILDFPGGD